MVGVVGFDLISVSKERDNLRKGKVLRRRNVREVKEEISNSLSLSLSLSIYIYIYKGPAINKGEFF